jgi:hypothetical protein
VISRATRSHQQVTKIELRVDDAAVIETILNLQTCPVSEAYINVLKIRIQLSIPPNIISSSYIAPVRPPFPAHIASLTYTPVAPSQLATAPPFRPAQRSRVGAQPLSGAPSPAAARTSRRQLHSHCDARAERECARGGRRAGLGTSHLSVAGHHRRARGAWVVGSPSRHGRCGGGRRTCRQNGNVW